MTSTPETSDAAALVIAARPSYEPGLALVAAELEKLPATVVEQLARVGVKVVVCGGSITDCATDLKGKAPRGWPSGSTWDDVPGAYLPDRQMVVIALTPVDGGGWRVPKFGEGHGSYNLIVHETVHGFDFTADPAPSAAAGFAAARRADWDQPELRRNHHQRHAHRQRRDDDGQDYSDRRLHSGQLRADQRRRGAHGRHLQRNWDAAPANAISPVHSGHGRDGADRWDGARYESRRRPSAIDAFGSELAFLRGPWSRSAPDSKRR